MAGITVRRMRVTVLGAGIIGTTSAFRLKQKFPELELSVVAGELSPHTTSDVAAGYWEPHLDPDTDPALVSSWSAQTYSLLADLAGGRRVESLDSLGPEMRGTVRRVEGTTVDSHELARPAWAERVSQYRDLSPSDIHILGPGPAPGQLIFANSFLSFIRHMREARAAPWEKAKMPSKGPCSWNVLSIMPKLLSKPLSQSVASSALK